MLQRYKDFKERQYLKLRERIVEDAGEPCIANYAKNIAVKAREICADFGYLRAEEAGVQDNRLIMHKAAFLAQTQMRDANLVEFNDRQDRLGAPLADPMDFNFFDSGS